MHSYQDKLLLNHFDEYVIPISAMHSHSTRLATSNNLFWPRVNYSPGKCSLILLALKCSLQYQMILSLQPRLPSNGNWRNTSDMIKIHSYEFLQNFTYPEPNSVNSVIFNHVYLCIFTFCIFLPCSHPILFSMKAHSIVFWFFFFCTSLIHFCFFYIMFKHIINHTKFLQINVIHSSVYIGMLFHLYIFLTVFCVCLFS